MRGPPQLGPCSIAAVDGAWRREFSLAVEGRQGEQKQMMTNQMLKVPCEGSLGLCAHCAGVL